MKCAEQEVQEAESITQALRDEALQKEKQSEMLDKAISDKRSKLNKEKGNQLLGAVADWATGKSKAMKNKIEDLRREIVTHEVAIERLQCKIQTMQNDHHRERMELEAKHLSELNRREAAHTEGTTRLKNRDFCGKTTLSAVSVSRRSKRAKHPPQGCSHCHSFCP